PLRGALPISARGARRPGRLRRRGWGCEHRAHRTGHQELEGKPEELRVPAGRARLPGSLDRGPGLGGPGPVLRRGSRGPLHLVVLPRQGLRQRRRMAHRLPVRYPRAGRTGQGCRGGPRPGLRPEVLRPRAAARGLRPVAAWCGPAWRGLAWRGLVYRALARFPVSAVYTNSTTIAPTSASSQVLMSQNEPSPTSKMRPPSHPPTNAPTTPMIRLASQPPTARSFKMALARVPQMRPTIRKPRNPMVNSLSGDSAG